MWDDFGRLLKEYREKNRLTQNQLVERLRRGGYEDKYSDADISKWEHGRTRPPEDVVEELEEILFTPNGLLLKAAGYYSAAEYRRLLEAERGKGKGKLEIVDMWLDKVVPYLGKRFCSLELKNVGEAKIEKCFGILELVNKPPNADKCHHLWWAKTSYYTPKVEADLMDVEAGEIKRLDIIFAIGEKGKGGTATSGLAYSISMGEHGEVMKIGHETGARPEPGGCWIATGPSLYRPTINDQHYLPPGEYEALLEIKTEGETLFREQVRLKSPSKGEELLISLLGNAQ